MTSLNSFAAISGALALALVGRTSVATPLNQGADAMVRANATISLIEKTHGCHRACLVGRVPRWGVVRFHRHIGPACVPVRC
jgi:hypothetical protein